MNGGVYKLLKLFAWGTYQDYKGFFAAVINLGYQLTTAASAAEFLPLSKPQLAKLRYLSLASLSYDRKVLATLCIVLSL